MRFASTMLASFLIPALAAMALAAPQYSIVDLGRVPGGDGGAKAYALNSAGHVVGSDINGTKAFLWTPGGGMQAVPELENDYPWITSFNAAYDISDRGEVVGESNNAGFVWDSDSAGSASMNLSKIHGSFFPYAISNDGTIIVGKMGGNVAAAIMPGAGLRQIPLPPLGYAEGAARAINSNGAIAGEIWRWEAGTGRDEWPEGNLWTGGPASQNLGLLHPDDQGSRACGLNDQNDVVGWLFDAEWNEVAFLWSEAGGLRMLDSLPAGPAETGPGPSVAYAVNNSGFIVGNSSGHAALWTEDGVLQLDQLLDGTGAGWVLNEARDINSRGQIVGWGLYNDEGYHAFILTPVPEPAMAGLVACAVAIGLLLRHRCCPRRQN